METSLGVLLCVRGQQGRSELETLVTVFYPSLSRPDRDQDSFACELDKVNRNMLFVINPILLPAPSNKSSK